MKRQADNTDSLVYAYGCASPHDNEHVQAEIERMQQMWDRLVQADREHEQRVEAAIIADAPAYRIAVDALRAAAAAIKDIIEARRAVRAKARAKIPTPELDARLKEAIAQRNVIRATLWGLAKVWRQTHSEATKDLEALRREANVQIRRSFTVAAPAGQQLYWGNSNRILDSFERGRQLARKLGRRMRPTDAQRDNGCLTVQIQRTRSGLGAAAQELRDGTFAALQIGPTPQGIEYLPTTRRRRECRTVMEMRVDATGHMIRLPIHMHRPLPEGSRVKSAQLVWRREGERMRSQLCLTVSALAKTVRHPSSKACGIDVGWRLQPDGALLVATAYDSDGALRRYCLDARWMGGMDQVERISGYIDDGLLEVGAWLYAQSNTNELLRAALGIWRPGLGARYINATALQEAVRTLNWSVPEPVEHWYRRYRHLTPWCDSLRAKLLRRRREQYRLLAGELARHYSLIGLEKLDLARLAWTKKAPDGADPALHAVARANRVRACLTSLRLEIEHQARKHGARIVYVAGPTTMQCHGCGEVTGQADRAAVHWVCQHCGVQWNQDENAARNILDAAAGLASGDPVSPPKRPTKGPRAGGDAKNPIARKSRRKSVITAAGS